MLGELGVGGFGGEGAMAGGGGGVVRVLVLVGMVLCVGTFPGRVQAWGADGHIATCLLAEVSVLRFLFGLEVCLRIGL